MKKILVVDDSDIVRKSIKTLLDSLQMYIVELATNGAEALEKLQAGGFDLVISDVGMPIMSGIELAQKIKQLFPRLPIILMSADIGQHQEAISGLGISSWFDKPIGDEELERLVKKAVGV